MIDQFYAKDKVKESKIKNDYISVFKPSIP